MYRHALNIQNKQTLLTCNEILLKIFITIMCDQFNFIWTNLNSVNIFILLYWKFNTDLLYFLMNLLNNTFSLSRKPAYNNKCL